MLSFKYRHIIAISGHKVHIDKFGFKNMIKYWQDGSLLKVLAAKPDGPEFDSQDPHSRERKTALNSLSCDLHFWYHEGIPTFIKTIYKITKAL